MRSLVCCGLFALVACGKSQPGDAEHESNGGDVATSGGTRATNGGATNGGATSNSHGGASGGTPDSLGGSLGDTGGSKASGGVGANAAGAGGTEANLAGASGDAGNAGAAGSPSLACGGGYDACGCGCCGGVTPSTVCYYPDRGDSLATIQRDDRNTAMSPSCANAGCSSGLRYVCCATPSDDVPGATAYETSGGKISDEIYRLSIYRAGDDQRCQFVHLARGDGPPRIQFPIALPEGWIIEGLSDSLCVDRSSADPRKWRQAIGGTGSVAFVGTSGECTLKYDFTLFFEASGGAVDAVRFVSEAEPAPALPECG